MSKIFFTVLFIHIMLTNSHNYCDICKNNAHTMCKYKVGPAEACKNYSTTKFNADMQEKTVNLHNRLRNKVASGEEKQGDPGPQPTATNIQILEWDEELATIAQRWADQCVSIKNINQHDECKDTIRFPLGQNVIQLTREEGTLDFEEILPGTIMQWYNEVMLVNLKKINSFQWFSNPEEEIGHYTQLIWGNTNKIGCAHVSFIEENQIVERLVCNYGPQGNVINATVYKIGKPCSQCKCSNKEYPALCGSYDASGNLEDLNEVEDFIRRLRDVSDDLDEISDAEPSVHDETVEGSLKPSYSYLAEKLFNLLILIQNGLNSSTSRRELNKLYRQYNYLRNFTNNNNNNVADEVDHEIALRRDAIIMTTEETESYPTTIRKASVTKKVTNIQDVNGLIHASSYTKAMDDDTTKYDLHTMKTSEYHGDKSTYKIGETTERTFTTGTDTNKNDNRKSTKCQLEKLVNLYKGLHRDGDECHCLYRIRSSGNTLVKKHYFYLLVITTVFYSYTI